MSLLLAVVDGAEAVDQLLTPLERAQGFDAILGEIEAAFEIVARRKSAAVLEMIRSGMTVTATAKALRLSKQRVSQLVADERRREWAPSDATAVRQVSAYEQAREDYEQHTIAQWTKAERDLRGHLLNRAGLAAGVDGRGLFTGPASRAARYGSEELLRWWQDNPRLTFTEFRAQQSGRPSAAATTARSRTRDAIAI